MNFFNNFYNRPDVKRFHYPGRLFSGLGSRHLIKDLIEPNSSVLLFVDQTFSTFNFDYISSEKIIVVSEPFESLIRDQIQKITQCPKYIISLGGGSTIDSAKAAISYFKCGHIKICDEQIMDSKPIHICIPTMIGSGSETSRYYVMTEKKTNFKISMRHWNVVPDFSILDHYYIKLAPEKLLVSGLFDSFTHLWETFVSRGESSPFTDTFTHYYLPKIIKIIQKYLSDEKLSEIDMLVMQQCSALGGIAISNTRTGLMHTLGESLVSTISLPHTQSLMVFFAEVVSSYWGYIKEKIEPIFLSIRINHNSPDELIQIWESAFKKFGIDKDIAEKVNAGNIDINKIMMSVKRDTVLSKENPVNITFLECEEMIRRSIQHLKV